MGSDEELRAGAETLDGAAIAWARAIARELGIDLVAGSILERVPGQAKLANTSVHVGSGRRGPRVYRKMHMFDVEVGGRSYRESELEEPGEEIVLSRTAGGVELGMSICYDLRFPELYRDPRRARSAHRARCRRRSRWRPRATTGRRSCGRGRSRTRRSCRRQPDRRSTRPVSTRAGAR